MAEVKKSSIEASAEAKEKVEAGARAVAAAKVAHVEAKRKEADLDKQLAEAERAEKIAKLAALKKK